MISASLKISTALGVAAAWDNSHPVKDNAEDLLVLTIGGERSPNVYAFSPQSLQETKVPNAIIARKAGGAIFYNDTLIACGGVSEDVRDRSDISTCSQYTSNLRELRATTIPSLPYALQYFSMIEYRHQLLVIGGTWRDPQTRQRTRSEHVWQLDNLGNGWQNVHNLTISRSSHKCVVIFPDNHFFVDITQEPSQDVYCFGGLTNEGRSGAMEVLGYDSGDKWSMGADMSIARSAFAATGYKSKIYVTGGKNNEGEIEDTVDIYDVRDEKWRLFAPKMSMQRYYHTSFYIDGYLFLRGGSNKHDSEEARSSIELISIDKFTGNPGTEFMDFHTSYDGKSLHNSVIVPKNFLPVILNDENLVKDYHDTTKSPEQQQLWEEDDHHHQEKPDDEILYGQVDTALSEQILAANKIVEEVVTDVKSLANLTEVVAEIIESKVEKHVSTENSTTAVESCSSHAIFSSFICVGLLTLLL